MKTSTPKATCYKWVKHDGQKLFDVGILADGTIRNPNGYPEQIVRLAVEAANERWRVKRAQAAVKAVATRKRRREKQMYDIANKIMAGGSFGPRSHCANCRKGLNDPLS